MAITSINTMIPNLTCKITLNLQFLIIMLILKIPFKPTRVLMLNKLLLIKQIHF